MTTTNSFSDYGLQGRLVESLQKINFTTPSAIQELTIEPILSGKDIFAQAETGSGKTGSFAIPIVEQILREGEPTSQIEKAHALYAVLCPTRELAQQTHKFLQEIGTPLSITSACVIGGEDIEKQSKTLEDGVHVLIATPGRLKDLIGRKIITLKQCRSVVFDEADRLFDMGFQKDIENILSEVPKSRQLIMVSATTNMEVMNTAYKFHSEPLELKLNADDLVVDKIDHKLAMVSKDEKMSLLVSLLRKREENYTIVFCNTQFQTHTVAEWLRAMGFKAKPISGRLAQNKRTKLLDQFRSKEVTVLVCTDVAARGLDIKDVNFVVNYDLPQEAANYVHRIGRTGRAGKDGQAVSFCAYEDCENLDAIYELLNSKIEKIDLSDEDFAQDLCKKPFIDAKTLKVVERSNQRPQRERKERSKKMPRENTPREKTERNVILEGAPRTKRVDKRFFNFSSYNVSAGENAALKFLGITDKDLLGHKILEEGRRKFFIFGPKMKKIKYFIKPIYKKVLTPFAEELIKKSHLDLSVRISFKKPYLTISFSGKDENLLLANNNALLYSFEQIIKTYLIQKVEVHRGLKYSVKCYKNSKNQKSKLLDLADKLKKKVIKDQKSQLFKSLSPSDRRIIHQHFSEDKDVKTISIGDGKFKQIELALK